MRVQAEVSLYPLRRPSLAESVNRFLEHLGRTGLRVRPGPMSSQIEGAVGEVFGGLAEAFEAAANDADVVMVVKVSNACPKDVPT